MSRKPIRIAVWTLIAVFAVGLFPGKSDACEWLDRLMPWNWCRDNSAVAATTYCPPYVPATTAVAAAPAACTTCATCMYVPQTCYRTAYQTVPVTSCCPTVCCDPCTGCACTTYQPVTSYVRQAQLVPYTTYQAVYSAAPCTTCAPCTSCAPAVTTAAPVSSGCCGATTPYYSPPAAAPSSNIPPTPAPVLGTGTSTLTTPGTNSDPAPRRSYQFPKETNGTETRFKPVPTEEPKSGTSAPPALIGPTSNTAMLGARQAAYVTPISNPVVSNSSGWRASRD